MAKRYGEAVEIDPPPAGDRGNPPQSFRWRGSAYRIVAVLGHWREDAGYWSGAGIDVPQRDLWRVEARSSQPRTGVFELVREHGRWRLDRVWD